MTLNIITFFIFYKIIIFTVLGYGFLFERIFYKKVSYNRLGYSGLFGILILILYSYASHLFLPHGYLHNSFIIFFGLILFFLYIIKNKEWFDFKIFLINFLILFIALLIFKTHDDFPYYHFPYSYHLTQHLTQIGIGQFNHGFRTPSSIFYLNSLFFLPIIKYYAFYIPTLLIMGFSNLILISKIFSNLKKRNINYSFYLAILFFAFINIFFYRIQEHGTDRSAQILVFILILQLINLIDFKKGYQLQIDYILITLGIIISLKAFYILYLVIAIPIMWIFYKQKKLRIVLDIFKNKIFYLFISLLFITLLIYFLNTGCLIYPLYQTCFDNFNWSLGTAEAIKMNNHYQLWSKAGLTPSFRIEDPELYLVNFNWVSNWFDLYFFNKMTDFLLGLTFLSIICLLIFYKKKRLKINFNKNILFIFFVIFLLTIEWFINHPALRYGGYVLIASLILLPVSMIISKYNISVKDLYKRLSILFVIVILIFVTRNLNRIHKEVKQYNYKPILNSLYFMDQSHFRINDSMNKLILNLKNCENNSNECDKNLELRIKRISSNRYIFIPE